MTLEVDDLITNYETIKGLWDYFEFLYVRKDNLSCMYKLRQDYFGVDQGDNTLIDYFTKFNCLLFLTKVILKRSEATRNNYMSFIVHFQILTTINNMTLKDVFA